MELKAFQKDVLGDLKRFLSLLTEHRDIHKAYEALWNGKGVSVGLLGMPHYHMTIRGVPQVCMKVPTGGGKTFLAANSIKPIFDAMPHIHPKAVAWMVPSEAILRQTAKALMERNNPLRQKLETDFSGRVEIYTKEQLLVGQNFNPTSVDENLSVFVLSYDSFRTSKKEGRKAYQQNGNLTLFTQYFNDSQQLLPDTDETALIQVIRSLNPVVVVDESHHATSQLSVEMLENFNPSFVLELTATPKKDSNIISVVDARKLKKEEMVKLPVIVYNQKNQEDVFFSAIALRNRLEAEAVRAEESGERYIRPIVLFQAQPRVHEDSTTYEKIRQSLLAMGIPAEQIAIKTGEKDEIKDMDLMSRECKIRYIITVNALKEGWDCPFAYILATVANRSSVVDVEQILGRVLRMPYAKARRQNLLNMSYAITSSADFHKTLDRVVSGLVSAGFSKTDHRVGSMQNNQEGDSPTQTPDESYVQGEIEINPDVVRERLEAVSSGEEVLFGYEQSEPETGRLVEGSDVSGHQRETDSSMIDGMVAAAEDENRVYWETISTSDAEMVDIPQEVAEKMETFRVRKQFRDEIKDLVLPQFMRDDGIMLFTETGHEYLEREELREGFTLRDKDTIIDFGSVRAELAKVDLENSDEATPKAFQLLGSESEAVRKWFDAKPSDAKRRLCKDIIVNRISSINAIGDADIADYVERVMGNMSEAMLSDLEQAPELYANRIREKVLSLLQEHEAKTFHLWMEQDHIVCEPNYRFKDKITMAKGISSVPKSLYEEEDGNVNEYERKVIWDLAGLKNIRWWHRNPSKRGFAINGAVTAYPDLIVKTESGRILIVETKGDYLDNPESRAKAETGAEWAGMAGRAYKYYMVFQTKKPGYPGSYSYDDFMKIVKDL